MRTAKWHHERMRAISTDAAVLWWETNKLYDRVDDEFAAGGRAECIESLMGQAESMRLRHLSLSDQLEAHAEDICKLEGF